MPSIISSSSNAVVVTALKSLVAIKDSSEETADAVARLADIVGAATEIELKPGERLS